MNRIQKIAKKALRLLAVLLAIAPLAYALYNRWAEVADTLRTVDWRQIGLAMALLILVMPLMAMNSWVSLHYIGGKFTFLEAAGFYFSSQAPKYFPGGFWAIPGRMIVYQAKGLGRIQSIMSVFREVSALFLGAAAVGLLGLFQGLLIHENLRIIISIGLMGSIVVIVMTQVSWFWNLLSRLPFLRSAQLNQIIENRSLLSLRWLPGAFAVSVAFWMILGLPFRYLAMAVNPAAAELSWLSAASIFALAWCGGFVVVVVPAGLGIRESLLALLLTPIMPASEALSAALLSRLWWMAAEAFYVVISIVWIVKSTDLSILRIRQKSSVQGEALIGESDYDE